MFAIVRYARDSKEKADREEGISDQEDQHALYPPKDLPIPRPHCLTRSGEWFPWPYGHRKGTIFGGVGDTCLRCRRLETGPKCRGSFRLTTKVCHDFVSTHHQCTKNATARSHKTLYYKVICCCLLLSRRDYPMRRGKASIALCRIRSCSAHWRLACCFGNWFYSVLWLVLRIRL